ncbi:MAG: hypothetical protein AB7F50_04765 [Fimbriimonadaceae bacterium]
MRDRELQDRVAKLVVGGAMLSLVSFLVMLSGIAGGTLLRNLGGPPTLLAIGVIAIVGLVAGLVLISIGIAMGMRRVTRRHDGAARLASGVYIVSVVCEDRSGKPILDPEQFDEDDVRYFARVRFPEGHVDEFKVALPVLSTMGEGMTGTMAFVGDRLVQFEQERADMADPGALHRP